MSSGDGNSYGWATPREPESCAYITPDVLRILAELGAHRVCDVGSGNGALASAMHTAGFQVVGIEPDEGGVARSREHHPGIAFYNLGVEDDASQVVAEEGALFDVVVSTEVVEHLHAPHLLPIFARRLLSPEGHLVVSTPYHGYLKNLALSVLNKWDAHHTPFWCGGHIKFWSRRTLTRLLEDNGFRVVAFRGVGRCPWLWKSMIVVARAA